MRNLPTGREIAGGGLPLAGMVQSASNAESAIFDSSGVPNDLIVLTGNDFYYEGSSEFALTPEGCILTYTGADIDVLVSIACSPQFIATGIDIDGTLSISHNGDLLGSGTQFSTAQYRAGVALMAVNGIISQTRIKNVAVQRRLSLSTGDTIQPVGGTNAASDLRLASFSMSVIQVATP